VASSQRTVPASQTDDEPLEFDVHAHEKRLIQYLDKRSEGIPTCWHEKVAPELLKRDEVMRKVRFSLSSWDLTPEKKMNMC
jgi:hypothetical protein